MKNMTNLLALKELETHLEAIREDGNATGGNVTIAAMVEAISEIRKRHIPDLPDDIPGEHYQIVLMALAHLTVERPGWAWTIRELVKAWGEKSEMMYDEFLRLKEAGK